MRLSTNSEQKNFKNLCLQLKKKNTRFLISQGENIITSNAEGDKYFIIQSGEIGVVRTSDSDSRMIKIFKEEESFGTFGLLYRIPKNCTLKSLTDTTLFSLNREVLTFFKRTKAKENRKICFETLSKLEFFSNLESEQKHNLIDVMNELKFVQGEEIVKQNQNLDYFFIVLEGRLNSATIHSFMKR